MSRSSETGQESMNTSASSEIASIHLSFEPTSDGAGWLVGKQEAREFLRPPAAEALAPTQAFGRPALSCATGAGPARDRGLEKAPSAHAVPSQVQHVQPATPRWGFTLPAFSLLRSYVKFSFPGNARRRGHFEMATPEATGLGWLLDVADIVLEAAEEIDKARQRDRREAEKRAAKRRANRRDGGRR